MITKTIYINWEDLTEEFHKHYMSELGYTSEDDIPIGPVAILEVDIEDHE